MFHLILDPRAGLVLLLLSNIVVFFQESALPGNVCILLFALLLLVYGQGRAAWKSSIFFLVIVLLQRYVFPIAPGWVIFLLAIPLNYGRRMLPCIMAGVLLIKTNTMHRLILAMRKLHFPQSLIIPIAVAVRYFPALKEEFLHIREAMKLRRVSWIQRIEGCIVPLTLSASNTAEELSQAAVTRGIENPGPKTSAEKLQLRVSDWIVMAIGFGIMAGALIWENSFIPH